MFCHSRAGTFLNRKMGVIFPSLFVFFFFFVKWFSVFCLRFGVILCLHLCKIIGFTLWFIRLQLRWAVHWGSLRVTHCRNNANKLSLSLFVWTLYFCQPSLGWMVESSASWSGVGGNHSCSGICLSSLLLGKLMCSPAAGWQFENESCLKVRLQLWPHGYSVVIPPTPWGGGGPRRGSVVGGDG